MENNNKERDGHFVLFPLSLIQGFIQDPCMIDRIAEVGIYQSSRKIKSNLNQAIYCYIVFWYRWGTQLGATMTKWFQLMGSSYPLQEDLIGRDILDETTGNIKANISKEDSFIHDFIEKHPEFTEDLLEWFCVMKMIKQLNYTFNKQTITSYETGKTVMKDHPEYENDPLIALDGEVLANMWKIAKKSTPELRARWVMYLGMLSIIGTKQIAETTSVAIKSRMFGAKDANTLQEVLKDEETHKLYDYWTSRRHYEGLLAEIEYSNKIKSQGVGRRTYISYRFSNDEDFVKAISKGSIRKQMACAKKSRNELLNNLKNKEKKKI